MVVSTTVEVVMVVVDVTTIVSVLSTKVVYAVAGLERERQLATYCMFDVWLSYEDGLPTLWL